MTSFVLRGVPISFPFEPYSIQKDYMDKVLESIQNNTNAVLESPTGTGKTLSLLCSSLAWLSLRKAQVQAQSQSCILEGANNFLKSLQEDLSQKAGGSQQAVKENRFVPKIIYASRTHSQLSQAMSELKRTAYSHMKAYVIGSREQLCIHPDVVSSKENKNMMCQIKVQAKECGFYTRTERCKENNSLKQISIIDIEDLIKLGRKERFCPYYMAHELKQNADILFMPYNYLLDPRIRSRLKIDLYNTIVILDEAHNIEDVCEECASLQLKSTDIALCIDEVSEMMKALSEGSSYGLSEDSDTKDVGAEELIVFKETLLNLEKALDAIPLSTNGGTTFEGKYIYEFFGKAGITGESYKIIVGLCERIRGFLSTTNNDGPYKKNGEGLHHLEDIISTIFIYNNSPEHLKKINECFRVHLAMEDKKKLNNLWAGKFSKEKQQCRVLNYWCFNPGFGMNMLMSCGVNSVILTSGTLAPLPPLISELNIKVDVHLENPHVVTSKQICVKLVSNGPDQVPLNCSYNNRTNQQYLSSTGRTILNIIRVIPDGVLIFFPSYALLKAFCDNWRSSDIWHSMNELKPIVVEPTGKDAFNAAMNDYYTAIRKPESKGAIFMGVCRGKIAEGLDFVNENGRAVIVIGIPYGPLMDPKINLKRKYLDTCNSRNKEYLRGEDWYGLQAVRAVNQAIGRIIRHRYDYGAIILLDNRFNNARVRGRMSAWLRDRIDVVPNFGVLMRDVKNFFVVAKNEIPEAAPKPDEFSRSETAASANVTSGSSSSGLVKIHKRNSKEIMGNESKKKKIIVVKTNSMEGNSSSTDTNTEYMLMVRDTLCETDYKIFLHALKEYNQEKNFASLTESLDKVFLKNYSIRFLLAGLVTYIFSQHKTLFDDYYSKMR